MLNKSMYARIKNCQRGAVIVLFALMLPVLFGFMGLGIDVGLAYVEKGKVQDIADSAALAGAAHLADDNRLDAIKAAVKEYVEANGITLGENGMLLKATNESWDEKETLAAGQDALVAYGVVSVTNSEGAAVDRVRVRVTKRIPSFFVNVIGDFSDGFVIVAKAAAEGEGKEPISVAGKLPLITARSALVLDYHKHNANITLQKGMDFTIMAPELDLDLLPEGTYISNSATSAKQGQEWLYYGWTEKSLDWYPSEEDKAKVRKVLETKKAVSEAEELAKQRLNQALADKQDFINGNSDKNSNKRYIDKYNPIIQNPKNGIDLFIDTEEGVSSNLYSGGVPVLTDKMLNGVKYIKNIYTKGTIFPTIDTNDVYYNNIYSQGGISISGDFNHFNGLLYEAGGNIYLKGNRNSFFDYVTEDLFGIIGSTVRIGYGYDITYFDKGKPQNPDEPIPINAVLGKPVKGEFKISFGKSKNNHGQPPPMGPIDPGKPGEGGSGEGGSGEGSGSGSSGSSTMGKLRLVE